MRHRSSVRAALAAVLVIAAAILVAPATTATAAGEARLSLFKRIENLDTGSSIGDRSLWDVQAVNVATGQTFRGQGLNGIQSTPVPPGTYRISEIVRPDTPGGYRFTEWDCGGSITTAPVRTITLTADQQLTCTVTNEAISPTLTLIKEVVGGSADPSLWLLRADGPSSIQGQGNSADVTARPVRVGRYQLSETGGPSGYVAGGWSCRSTTLAGASAPLPVEAGGWIDVGLDQSVTCTIRNTGSLPQLTLRKQVEGPGGAPVDSAAEWTLSAAGPTPVSGTTGSTEASHVAIAPGTYALSEAGPAGYAAGEWVCVNVATTPATPLPVTAGTITITGAEDVQCSIVNTFSGGWLTLVKEVDGPQPPQAWTLIADSGADHVEGVVGDAAVTREPVAAGTYDLTESGPTDGYTTDGWQCSNSTGFVDTVDVAPGEEITCTIENVSVTSHLTLVKQVQNAGGGVLAPGDWTLAATGDVDSFSGPSGSPAVTYAPADPGVYELGETSASADADLYAAGAWSCIDDATGEPEPMPTATSVVIDGTDDSVTCTITNTWTRSTLTLRKRAIAQFGTVPPPSSWTLQAQSGATTITGAAGSPEVTAVSIPGGLTWSLSEVAGPGGFEEVGWSCPGVDPTGQITIPGGRDVVCEVLNNGLPPRITLVKQIDDAAGGTASIGDFEIKTRGPGNAAFAGASGTPAVTGLLTPPGEYVFSEDGPAGYDVSWSCTGTAFDPATETATLGFGDVAVCTALNTAIAPSLSLVKEVEGGEAGPALWTLRADGPSDLEGRGAVDETDVIAGVYTLSETSSAEAATDYGAGDWVCEGPGFPGAGGVRQTGEGTAELTLPLDAAVTCTIVNTFGDPVEPTDPPTPTGPPSPTGPPNPIDPTDPTGGGSGGALPGTGGDGTLALMVGGVALLVVVGGITLIVVSRRRSRAAEERDAE